MLPQVLGWNIPIVRDPPARAELLPCDWLKQRLNCRWTDVLIKAAAERQTFPVRRMISTFFRRFLLFDLRTRWKIYNIFNPSSSPFSPLSRLSAPLVLTVFLNPLASYLEHQLLSSSFFKLASCYRWGVVIMIQSFRWRKLWLGWEMSNKRRAGAANWIMALCSQNRGWRLKSAEAAPSCWRRVFILGNRRLHR